MVVLKMARSFFFVSAHAPLGRQGNLPQLLQRRIQ